MVCSPHESVLRVAADGFLRVFRIVHEDGQRQDPDSSLAVASAGYAADSYAVIVDGCDDAGNVCAVVPDGDVGACAAEDEALAAVFPGWDADGREVFVIKLYALVQNGHYNLGRACGKGIPDVLDVDVAALGVFCRGIAVVVEGPLLARARVVEIGSLADAALRLGGDDAGN